ncbi:MAG: AraC family transcriptional regulator [Bacteroidales bacterium]|nr:AraC family transcriptional regulator [Bacteroidales bacterium]
MITDVHVSVFDVIIFLGVFQGLLLAWFFIKNYGNEKRYNLFQGLLLISLSLAIFEEWLNNTGFIVRVLYLTNFTESFNFAFGPLLYFYIWYTLNPESKRKAWPHLIPFFFWSLYLVFQFIQPDEAKYNSYLQTKHPDWPALEVVQTITDDPLGIRIWVNQMMLVQLLVYMGATVITLLRRFRSLGQPVFGTSNELLRNLRNFAFQFLCLIALMIITKTYFGMRSDIGTYFIATYVSVMIYMASWRALSRSDYFEGPASFLSFPAIKYQKSSLSDDDKEAILKKIRHELEINRYYANNLASLSGLSKQINESSHHVSQVINEKLGQSFFELLAFYRVEQARKIITGDKGGKITIEELAEMVGYNSKSSFNTAFRKLTSQTPSEFRKSVNKS